MWTEHLADLTEPQLQAVTHVDGPLLVLAGPGSGKTRVVTCRIANLMSEGIPPHSILALTFTNKAADEMRCRLETLTTGQTVWMSTFHRFCSKLLRRYASLVGLTENFTIYDSDDAQKALKATIEESEVSLRRYTPVQLARVISNAKNELATPEQFLEVARSPLESLAAEVYPEYQKRLIRSNAVDFDDLLMHVAVMLHENPQLRSELDAQFRYILVDEYQDTNLAQYTIVRALSIDNPNLSVTGDPDQSIYAWRGADITNILEFEKDYPHVNVVRLEQNYRSSKHILRVADQLIVNNKQRKQKSLFTENPDGDAVRLVRYNDAREEAGDIARQIADAVAQGTRTYRDFAILYRTNALSRNFEHALRDHGVPYHMVNGVEFYKRKEIKDVLAYLHLINNPQDDVAFLRIINTPPRGIGKKSIGLLREFAHYRSICLLEAARHVDEISGLTAKPRKAMTAFVNMFDGLREAVNEPVEALVGRVLMDTGYQAHLEDSQTEEDQQRLANVQELLTAARQFDDRFEDGGSLDEFLEQSALVGETDNWDSESDKVTLMTMHAAKGLEFSVIYVIAVEHGILPHERSKDDPMRLEEERRLLFVAITRAKHFLQLSLTQARQFRGRTRQAVPSSFLLELPREEMDCFGIGTYDMIAHTGFESGFQSEDGFADASFDDVSFDPASFGADDGIDGADAVNETDELAAEWAQQQMQQEAIQNLAAAEADGFEDASPTAPLMTASQMESAGAAGVDAGGDSKSATESETDEEESISPEAFELGMLVTHPQYGPGKVISLSGRREKRTATVQFLQPPEQRKFRLSFCPLRPVQAGKSR